MIGLMLALATPVHSANTPCSKKKGGIVGCIGTKFLCRDGSTSASKKTCSQGDADSERQDEDEKKDE